MSSKTNVIKIIKSHFSTLNKTDLITFILFPLLLSILSYKFSFAITKDFGALLVNFSSIFTALLLSVLVLIYEQENKLEDRKNELNRQNTEQSDNTIQNSIPFYNEKKELLHQLYNNICYCIIASMLLFSVAAVGSLIDEKSNILYLSIYLLTPISIFVASNLNLTILMIVKRMHTLLTTR